MAINSGGVIKGGLVAGLVLNIGETILNVPVLGQQMEAEMAARNLPPMDNSLIPVFIVSLFVLGILLVWIYAAIRPRFGPGPGTAAIAGLITWALGWLFPSIGFGVMGFFSWAIVGTGIVWGLAENVLAAVAGAYFYKE